MNTYESKQKQLFKPQAEIYATLSDLTQLEKYVNALPTEHKDKIKNLSFTPDSISFNIDTIGHVVLRIIDYETPKMLKFGAENFPINFNFWIQLVSVSDYDTRMKLTLKADIPFILKPMIGDKLDIGIERIADMITMIINR